jgi:uncharacterized protein with PhoU and TrkA domain
VLNGCDSRYKNTMTKLTGSLVLQPLDLRRTFGVWIVGIKDALTGKLSMFPDGDFRVNPDQLLLLVGKQKEVEQLREAN